MAAGDFLPWHSASGLGRELAALAETVAAPVLVTAVGPAVDWTGGGPAQGGRGRGRGLEGRLGDRRVHRRPEELHEIAQKGRRRPRPDSLWRGRCRELGPFLDAAAVASGVAEVGRWAVVGTLKLTVRLRRGVTTRVAVGPLAVAVVPLVGLAVFPPLDLAEGTAGRVRR